MADKLNWGILATGGIARQFAGGLKVSKTGTLVAVGSRTLESATKFTDTYGGTPYGSYDEVLSDPNVQAVYIALPHHMHYEWTIKCAEAGKAILCEKPFTLNALEARRALDEVAKHGVFFMEAFMYRCHPQTLKLRELLAANVVGQIKVVNSEFGFQAGKEWENFRTEGALGGGGLMDVGTYCVSLTRLVAASEPESAHYSAYIGDKGYDEIGTGCMKFPGEFTASFGTGVHINLRNGAWVYGTEGMIHIDNPWKASGGSITVYRRGQEPEAFEFKSTNDELYGIEADAVAEFIDAKECPHMTWEDTVNNMRALDMLRASAGLVFAMETKA
ncbi:MAG: Gfo/Idh/MocA family oxidoreductase [Fimbriimonas sp.]|nr:Gfo/Idh/MocA family oxidoreductase [Fimbriimonas sp.]